MLSAFAISFGYGRASLAEPPRQVVQEPALLSTDRQRLISMYNQLAGPLAEPQGFIDPTLQKQFSKNCQASLLALEKDRKAVEKAIDAPLRRSTLSVKIITFDNGLEFACHESIAHPFQGATYFAHT